MDMKKIISNLKFLGSLKPNDKFNSKFLYVQPDGIFTRITRTFFSYDNRNNALKFIEETINSSFEVLSHYELSNKPSDKSMCENIVKDLISSKAGITSLKMTYNEDIRFCCDIETLIQMLDSRMLDITQKYNIILETNEDIKDIKNIKKENDINLTDLNFIKDIKKIEDDNITIEDIIENKNVPKLLKKLNKTN